MQRISDWLLQLGVEKIFFGCGNRNEPLINAFSSFDQEYFFDERVASFQALGFAKATNRPTAICVTSGTAVSECFSAIVEAYYSRIPLVIITADRPERLRFTHAAQAIDQINIFGKFVKTFINWNANIKAHDLGHEYPIQINIEIDDAIVPPRRLDSILETKEVNKLLEESLFPLVVITEGHGLTQDEFENFAGLGIPFFLEVTSQLKNQCNYPHQIKFEKTIKSLLSDQKIDLILKYGKTPIASLWRDLDRKFPEINVICIGENAKGIAHGHRAKHYIPNVKKDINFSEASPDIFIKEFPLSEAGQYKKYLSQIKDEDILFVGNSMPIRYTQLISPKYKNIYASRGVNGIDGQISTAMGMAKAFPKKNVFCFIGDLTFLYDLNAIFQNFPSNLKVYVFNNMGGGIFKRVSSHQAMSWEHEINIEGLIRATHYGSAIEVINCDKTATENFWKKWNEA